LFEPAHAKYTNQSQGIIPAEMFKEKYDIQKCQAGLVKGSENPCMLLGEIGCFDPESQILWQKT